MNRPFWSAYVLADGQMAFFYPPSLLFMLLPLWRAFGYYALLQLILAGTGSYCFTRQIGLGRGARTLTGIGFMFSGFMLTWSGAGVHWSDRNAPWCLWAADHACNPNRRHWWAITGVLLAMPVVTHIQSRSIPSLLPGYVLRV